jgi:hypothetical protein
VKCWRKHPSGTLFATNPTWARKWAPAVTNVFRSPELREPELSCNISIRKQFYSQCSQNTRCYLVAQWSTRLNICWVALNFPRHLQHLYSDQVLEDGVLKWPARLRICLHLPHVDVRNTTCRERLVWPDVIRTNYTAITHLQLLLVFLSRVLPFVCFYVLVYLSTQSLVVPVN